MIGLGRIEQLAWRLRTDFWRTKLDGFEKMIREHGYWCVYPLSSYIFVLSTIVASLGAFCSCLHDESFLPLDWCLCNLLK